MAKQGEGHYRPGWLHASEFSNPQFFGVLYMIVKRTAQGGPNWVAVPVALIPNAWKASEANFLGYPCGLAAVLLTPAVGNSQ